MHLVRSAELHSSIRLFDDETNGCMRFVTHQILS